MSIRKIGFSVLAALIPIAACAQPTPSTKKATARTSDNLTIVTPGAESWQDPLVSLMVGNPSVRAGGIWHLAIIQGDPATAGRTYTMRLSCTDGARVAPNWNPERVNVTVLQGEAAVGIGSKWDDAALKDVPTEGFFSVAPHTAHFLKCKGDTILQVQGAAPYMLNFVSAQ